MNVTSDRAAKLRDDPTAQPEIRALAADLLAARAALAPFAKIGDILTFTGAGRTDAIEMAGNDGQLFDALVMASRECRQGARQ